jgi:polyferredoxin
MAETAPTEPVAWYASVEQARRQPASRPDARRKALVHRQPDQAQLIRRTVQVVFLLLNLWIGTRFYFFVRFYETGGQTVWIPRPAGVEGWLPIAGLMNLKSFALTGLVPNVHPAGMFLLAAFLGISWLARKAFCSWLCPVGTLSEWLWQGGREIFGRNFPAPRWLDIPLRGLKYLLLGFFVWAVSGMSASDIAAFIRSPYGLVADVKMLNFFRHLGEAGAISLGVLVVGSVLVQNLWCRYLCPYGALVGLVALLSPARIRRDPDACIDCAKCAKACPSLLPVDTLLSVKSAECTACLECVTICPAQGALRLTAAGGRRAVPAWAVATLIAVVFLGTVGYAKLTGHWNSAIPDAAYRELVPAADSFEHPR